jgi:uncharacterized membrane protein YsdA (DUF1294 family)
VAVCSGPSAGGGGGIAVAGVHGSLLGSAEAGVARGPEGTSLLIGVAGGSLGTLAWLASAMAQHTQYRASFPLLLLLLSQSQGTFLGFYVLRLSFFLLCLQKKRKKERKKKKKKMEERLWKMGHGRKTGRKMSGQHSALGAQLQR